MREFMRSGSGTINQNEPVQTPFPGSFGPCFLSIGTAS
jgi:hypothetical protein